MGPWQNLFTILQQIIKKEYLQCKTRINEKNKTYLHLSLHLKVDIEGATLTSCSNSFQTFDPRNENAFWPLLILFVEQVGQSHDFSNLQSPVLSFS